MSKIRRPVPNLSNADLQKLTRQCWRANIARARNSLDETLARLKDDYILTPLSASIADELYQINRLLKEADEKAEALLSLLTAPNHDRVPY